jgi:HPt (histidine-containing phosphotransfer) domain-containing protein
VRGDLEATLGRTRLVDLLLDWPASIRTSLDALAAARGMPDGPDRAETLGRQAHALRGTAANYGFDRLAVLAQQVRENPAGAESLIDALCAEAQAAIADVDAYVAPSAPATAAR